MAEIEFDERGRPIVNFEARAIPRKFESSGPLGKVLYKLSLEGWHEEELGDIIYYGLWAALFPDFEFVDKGTGKVWKTHAIVVLDRVGDVYVDLYSTKKELMKAWRKLKRDYKKWFTRNKRILKKYLE